ncbi:hypothetical protein ACIBAG_30275 [Streptomyces sp. NPDC051243]|uniref:hypothetical protein n=1 Tax=Streptomyces sp. NPDC051243 TaxID=3365646 RepID=UPI00379FA658
MRTSERGAAAAVRRGARRTAAATAASGRHGDEQGHLLGQLGFRQHLVERFGRFEQRLLDG